jgi:hypothetical protein
MMPEEQITEMTIRHQGDGGLARGYCRCESVYTAPL